ncbi:MAG TPA: endonuclease/exonuclease/phosphatase family protein [Gammaproteobacteria bacterium]|nr:endonuclease/exonuclease/phosphatase family protein [Gammaproteobacteria bacterium]
MGTVSGPSPGTVRVATFNVALAGREPGDVIARLGRDDPQALGVAAIIRHVRPDILLLNELDHDPEQRALDAFVTRYLECESGEGRPQHYPYRFAASVNTGVPSGFDLDRDGRRDGPGDALGFGRYPGQYGMALLSRYPLDHHRIRTFRRFPWQRLPGAELPRIPGSGAPWYAGDAAALLPLSSKSHWDVPVVLGERTVHVLASHPTPPAFDGPERRNRLRNAAETDFWRQYLNDEPALIDDGGQAGGLADSELAIVLGDLNADPDDGDGERDAIRSLIGHARLQDPRPRSDGATEWAHRAPRPPVGDPSLKTAWFGCVALRVDYVLPDRGLTVRDAGVFWPRATTPRAALIGEDGMQASSDHRLVWVDLDCPRPNEQPVPPL